MMAKVFLLSIFYFFSQSAYANAVNDYAHAQKCYHSLDKSKKEGWGLCLHQFQKVADNFPTSEQGTKALFSIAKISEEKFRLHAEPGDLERAFKSYNEFLRKYSSNSMADDALFQIALLRFEKQGDKEKAEKALLTLIQRYPQGDLVEEARLYREKLKQASATQIPEKAVVVEPVAEPVITANPEIEEETIVKKEVSASAPQTRQTPLSDFAIRTVVIDPGHGGGDSGAVGGKGTKESVVALQIARKVALKLKKDLNLQTYLTRTINRDVSLEERNAFANKQKADLFISIHANANPSKQLGGVQTFYLNNATSDASKRLAARENRTAGKPLDLSEKILSTMLQNANSDTSRDLAHRVQKALIARLKKEYPPIKDQKVDSALFYVLVGSKCPSILVETSFITNPIEELRLRDSDYQWAVAEGVANGVKDFIANSK